MLRSLSLLVDHRVPLPEALRLTADGITDAYVAEQCRSWPQRVEQGSPLWAALVDAAVAALVDRAADPLGRAEATALAEALRSAAEMLEGRLRSRHRPARADPAAAVCLVGTVAASLIALILPMVAVLQGHFLKSTAVMPDPLGPFNLIVLVIPAIGLRLAVRISVWPAAARGRATALTHSTLSIAGHADDHCWSLLGALIAVSWAG